MQFEFATATRIVFGAGTCAQVAPAAKELGRHVMLITGHDRLRADSVHQQLIELGLSVTTVRVAGEPTTETVSLMLEQARQANCDLVIGLGGGSVLDAGKAVAVLLTNPGEPLDYLEVIGRGQAITSPAAPYIAVPTTAGTGAEVTRNAVLGSPEHRVKVSLRSPLMLPRLAVVDPELTYSMPPEVTASTGLDALTQVIEPFVSNKANPFTDTLCREGIRRAARSLLIAYRDGSHFDAREDMALASLFGGLALANAKLGAVHGIAGPLGGMYPAPHGATCASLLPHVMTVNVQALRDRAPESEALGRYDEVAQLLTGRLDACAEEGVAWIEQLARDLNVPSLSRYGLTEQNLPELVEKAGRSSSMQGNPIQLTKVELQQVLRRAVTEG